jgi:hypothetical protein
VADAPCRGACAVRRAHQQVEGPEIFLFKSESLTDASLDAVAVCGGGGVLARDQDPQPSRAARAPLEIEGVAAETALLALAQQPLELRLLTQPALCIEAESLAGRAGDG